MQIKLHNFAGTLKLAATFCKHLHLQQMARYDKQVK
jgi:hypothetical protein